jgi:hypothetical protein
MPQPERIASNNPRHDWGGPYLTAAFFCRDVSANGPERTVIGMTHQIEMSGHAARFEGLLVVEVRPGRNRRPFVLGVFSRDAEGNRISHVAGDDQRSTVPDQDDAIVSWRIPVVVVLAGVGVYWWDVVIDGRLMTRVPMRVVPGRVTATIGPEERIGPGPG